MTKYPQYRLTRWIDTSDEAMSKPQATIIYGVQIKSEKGRPWLHCLTSAGPMHYETPEQASEAIKQLRKVGAASAAVETMKAP